MPLLTCKPSLARTGNAPASHYNKKRRIPTHLVQLVFFTVLEEKHRRLCEHYNKTLHANTLCSCPFLGGVPEESIAVVTNVFKTSLASSLGTLLPTHELRLVPTGMPGASDPQMT